MHLEGGGAWFFGCRLDLLIEQAWLRVLAVVNLRSSEASWSSCREVCSGRKLGGHVRQAVACVRQAVACVAGWTGSANEPIAVRTRPKTPLQVSRTAREIANALMMVTGSEQSGLLMMVAGMT